MSTGWEKSEFPVEKKKRSSLPSLFSRSDGDDRTLAQKTTLYPEISGVRFLFLPQTSLPLLRSRFTHTVTKLNPHVRLWSPAKRSGVWLHGQCGNAHPLLFFSLPPPSLSPQSVDHPETGSSLFVFLKKKKREEHAASLFSPPHLYFKLTFTTRYPLKITRVPSPPRCV